MSDIFGNLFEQVSQLGAVVQRYQVAIQNAPSGLPIQDLQNTCNSYAQSHTPCLKLTSVINLANYLILLVK